MRRLKKIYIEITNKCNLSCAFCPPHDRPEAFMSCADFRKITEKIKEKADILYFHVKGEPLLHPELGTLLDIALENGFSVHLTTNGTLLSQNMETLTDKKNLARINVSMHGIPEIAAEKQTDLARSILEAVERLSGINKKTVPGFLISLRLWTWDDKAEKRNIINSIEDFYAMEAGDITRRLAGKNGFIIHPGVVIHTAREFTWPSLSGEDSGDEGYCLGLRDQAAILVDGSVVPCCLDGDGIIKLGNILRDSWDTIMETERAQTMVNSFSNRRVSEELCRRCGFRKRFDTVK